MKNIVFVSLLLFAAAVSAAGNGVNGADRVLGRGYGVDNKIACDMAQMDAGVKTPVPRVCGPCEFRKTTNQYSCEYTATSAQSPAVRTAAPSQKPAVTRNVVVGGLVLSCEAAVKYRDTALATDWNLAYATFDPNTENRRRAALDKLDAELLDITKKSAGASKEMIKRQWVAAVGAGIGAAASMWGGALTKKGATQVEKRSVEALVGRGAEWSTFFGKYAALKEADVSTLVGMPITLLIAMTPVGTLAGVTIALTNGTIEGVTAHLEGGLEIDEANSMAANIRKQTHDIIAKLQLPTVASVNAIKNTIDKTCAEVATAVHQ